MASSKLFECPTKIKRESTFDQRKLYFALSLTDLPAVFQFVRRKFHFRHLTDKPSLTNTVLSLSR